MIAFVGNNLNAKYEKLAYDFEFKDLDDATVTDWDEMSKPLEYAYKTA